MNKFFSPKIFGKLIVVFAVTVFLWIMSATVSPIKPHRLEKYKLENLLACNVDNVNSWASTGGDLTIKSLQSSLTLSNRTDFIYQDPSTQLGHLEFRCKFNMPEMVLYKALTLNMTYKLNQPALFEVGIRRVGIGMGPAWKPVEVDSNNTNKVITSTWLLHDPEQPKFNWLSGPYEEVAFRVSKFDPNKELILSIYQVYLE